MTIRCGYDALVFDCDGVIVEPPDRSNLLRAARAAAEGVGVEAPSRETCRDLVTGNVERLRDRCRDADVDVAEFFRRSAEYAADVQRRALETGRRTSYPDADALRSLSLPLGLASDNQPQVLDVALRIAGLADRFEVVRGCPLDPDGLERRKPAPDHLRAVVDELGAERAAYVGDRAVDVAAADRAGLDAVLVDRTGGDEGESPTTTADDFGPAPAPDYRIESLRELPRLL